MTQAKTRKAAQQAPAPVQDPLADLREPTDERGQATGGLATLTQAEQAEPARVLLTQDAWDAARAEVIAGWHADTVALGFLHKGGNCGCRYLAGIALSAAMPAGPDDTDLEPAEPEDAPGAE